MNTKIGSWVGIALVVGIAIVVINQTGLKNKLKIFGGRQ